MVAFGKSINCISLVFYPCNCRYGCFGFGRPPARGQSRFVASWERLAPLMQRKFALLHETEGVSPLLRSDGCVALRRSCSPRRCLHRWNGVPSTQIAPQRASRNQRGPQFFPAMLCFPYLSKCVTSTSFDDGP